MYTIECMARLHILSIDWVAMFQKQITTSSFVIERISFIRFVNMLYKVHLKRACLFNGCPEGYLLKSHLSSFTSKLEVISPQFHIE